jgi:citrate synthase
MDAEGRVKSRGTEFARQASTSIWKEVPCEDNPYVAARCLCHGYDLLALLKSRSFVEVLYLLLKGDLPSAEQCELLEKLMIGLCNPGPRHPATRAGMNAGVSKTYAADLLPVSLLAMSGSILGAAEVEASMRFLRANWRRQVGIVIGSLIADADNQGDGACHIAPGFGASFGGIDQMTNSLAEVIASLPGAGRALAWSREFSDALSGYGMGWLSTGLAAAVFLDLGFHPRLGPGLFQLISAPGLLAHSTEMAARPMTAMPFLPDDRYIDECESRRG